MERGPLEIEFWKKKNNPALSKFATVLSYTWSWCNGNFNSMIASMNNLYLVQFHNTVKPNSNVASNST